MRVDWVRRAPPLEARGVVAVGEAARRLRDRALARLPGLAGVAGDGLLVVLAEPARVPWVDGATLIGPDPRAPRLWTPVHVRPTVHPALVAEALGERTLVWEGRRIPLVDAAPLGPCALGAWP